MFSFGAPQMIVAGYLAMVSFGTPVLRMIMIKNGARGFVAWADFWKKWSVDFVIKCALVGVLFWGGFWS